MLISRKASWYRPYYAEAGGKEFKIDKIHFYKDNRIFVSSDSGWLEKKNGEDLEFLNLPVDEIKTKRKENFDGSVFLISKGKENYGNDYICELYIPADLFNIHFVEYVIKYKSQVRAIYEGTNDIYISVFVKQLDKSLYHLRNEYEKIYNECDGYNFVYHTEETIKKLNKLKTLAKKYIKEKERIEDLTIDDIEL